MSQVTYVVNGRLGNNLFQYFAAKIICQYTGSTYVYSSHVSLPVIVTDKDFKDLYHSIVSDKCYGDKSNKVYPNYKLDGFFQFDWMVQERDYLRRLFIPDNKEKVNDKYTVGEIARVVLGENSVSDISSIYNISDIPRDAVVMHLRLDDFKHEGHNSEVIDPHSLYPALDALKEDKQDKLYIVCEKPKQKWESDYLRAFDKYSPTILHGEQLQDFTRLYHAKTLICSTSTFCWMAALLGRCSECYFLEHKTFQRINHKGVVNHILSIKYLKF